MKFPENRQYEFTVDKVYAIPSTSVGRPDLIAYDLFGSVDYYKAICAMNNIRMPQATRCGIRPESELVSSGQEIEGSDLWENYSNGNSGLIDELPEGKLILIPTLGSANEYLKRYS